MMTDGRSEEHTSELQSRVDLVCRLLLEKKKTALLARRVGGRRLHRGRLDAEAPDPAPVADASVIASNGKARGSEQAHFLFNDTATTEIYTLSLHDALPI